MSIENEAIKTSHIDDCDCANCVRRRGARLVRWMTRRDFGEVLEIEQLVFPEPWTERDFFAALRDRNVIGMVATSDSAKPRRSAIAARRTAREPEARAALESIRSDRTLVFEWPHVRRYLLWRTI